MSDLKDLKEELDKFIVLAFNNYCYVEKPWDELKKATGNDYDNIISKKSVIPDLVIYNKTFNKNECFFPFIDKYNPFPRQPFYIRKQKLKNKSLQNGKEIKNNLIEKNTNVINEFDNNKKDGDNYKINDFILKSRRTYNNILFRNFIINQLNKNNYKNGLNTAQNRKEEGDLEDSFNNNKERRNWQIRDSKTDGVINCFNNEQLYYFLNEMLKDEDSKYDFYISDSCFDKNYYDIRLIYEYLKQNLNI
jgi:hypothetical protein